MNLNDFSSFFEIFAGLCFIYAGSESFRFSLNDTILKLGETMDELAQNLDIRKSALQVDLAEDNPNFPKDKASTLAKDIFTVETVTNSEKKFRDFPEGFKSMFLMTAMFCLAVLLTGGFSQFFYCSEITHWILLCLDLVVFYNLGIFANSFREKNCSTNLPIRYPVLILAILIFAAAAAINFLPGVKEHCDAHKAVNDPTSALFSPHSNIFFDEKFSIIIALIVAVSPFLLHFVRVYWHKKSFAKKYRRLAVQLDIEETIAKTTENLLTRMAPAEPLTNTKMPRPLVTKTRKRP